MAIRKRTWSTNGIQKQGWQADYIDTVGKRRRKVFDRKKGAEAFLLNARTEVLQGVHVPDSQTITVAQAGTLWLKTGTNGGLERSTIEQRKQHLRLHIEPYIGSLALNKLTIPVLRKFQEDLTIAGRSSDMVRRVTVSLGSIIGDAQSRGLTIRNPVREAGRSSITRSSDARRKSKLRAGYEIPSPEEIRRFLGELPAKWRPLFITAVFTGMRSSELRGLTWDSVDLNNAVLHVRQRADDYNDIGDPKSSAGHRSIPVPSIVVNTLREWKLACPKGPSGDPSFVFPNGKGNVETRGNMIKRGLVPAMITAGVTITARNGTLKAKYSGMHALRHFYASWCINPTHSGGLGLHPKAVQERLGHSSITLTMDTYGHLFPLANEHELLAHAANMLIS